MSNNDFDRYVQQKNGKVRVQLAAGRFALGDDGKPLELSLADAMDQSQRRVFDCPPHTGDTGATTPEVTP